MIFREDGQHARCGLEELDAMPSGGLCMPCGSLIELD